VVKLCPEMSVLFVSSLLRACFANISAMSFADVEVSLYLLGLLGDASTQVGTKTTQPSHRCLTRHRTKPLCRPPLVSCRVSLLLRDAGGPCLVRSAASAYPPLNEHWHIVTCYPMLCCAVQTCGDTRTGRWSSRPLRLPSTMLDTCPMTPLSSLPFWALSSALGTHATRHTRHTHDTHAQRERDLVDIFGLLVACAATMSLCEAGPPTCSSASVERKRTSSCPTSLRSSLRPRYLAHARSNPLVAALH
jgi:hypothetical protein